MKRKVLPTTICQDEQSATGINKRNKLNEEFKEHANGKENGEAQQRATTAERNDSKHYLTMNAFNRYKVSSRPIFEHGLNGLGQKKKSREQNDDFKTLAKSKFTLPQKVLPFGLLGSCLFDVRAEDSWSPREISLFEQAMLVHGKNFSLISKLIKSKSSKDVVEFYYIWKKSKQYKSWKRIYYHEL